MPLKEKHYKQMISVKSNNTLHVFYIQNYTTFLVVNSLINHENLNNDDCLFLFGRAFSPETSTIQSIDLTPFTINYSIKFWKNWNKIFLNKRSINKIVEEQIKLNYIFYFPFTQLYFVRMICDHKKCISFNCLEDGVSAYWSIKERKKIFFKNTFISLIYSVKIFFNHYFTYLPIHLIAYLRYLEKGYRIFYTIGENGFLGTRKRIVLKSVVSSKPISEYMSMQYLYAPAALVEKSSIKIETFINSMKQVFKQLQENESITIHYRFHPLTTLNSKNMNHYKEVLNGFVNIQFIEIPKGIALEDILYHNNAVLITDISSIAIYANSYKKKVITYNKIISIYEPSFQKEVDIQPLILRNLLNTCEIN